MKKTEEEEEEEEEQQQQQGANNNNNNHNNKNNHNNINNETTYCITKNEEIAQQELSWHLQKMCPTKYQQLFRRMILPCGMQW